MGVKNCIKGKIFLEDKYSFVRSVIIINNTVKIKYLKHVFYWLVFVKYYYEVIHALISTLLCSADGIAALQV